jgi:threonine dehydratase
VPAVCALVAELGDVPTSEMWDVFNMGCGFVALVPEARADEAVALLARDGITAGESGAAGLAGLLAFHADLALAADATVLLVNTEGDTKGSDPAQGARTGV